MLVIDDNMLKLSKMQETLLERSTNDRQANLKKYESTVKEIDEHTFASLLNELDQINEHSQTLEDELQFLEQIKGYYEQLYEMQLNFKRVCERYGDKQLELSDLSQININYIENRISVISGYLMNLQNIDSNKKRLQELNEELVEEEKNKVFLGKKLKEYEGLLRENFIAAEGRCVVDGELQYISVISEYKKLGYDFKDLLVNLGKLSDELAVVAKEIVETEEKFKTAELCYNSMPSSDSKQVLDEITKEFLSVRYRLTMLKIVELLSQDLDDYDLFKQKRENLLDLIKYRMNCLSKLGVRISIDPFSRTKVSEQLEMISNLSDNSKKLNRIKKEIAELSQRVEEMLTQNNEYMVSLNNKEDLFVEQPVAIGLSDIDVSSVTWDVNDYFNDRVVLDNQVVSVEVVPLSFNLGRAHQKTSSVVKRCNEMVNGASSRENKSDEVIAPELVIVPQSVSLEEESKKVNDDIFSDLSLSFSPITDFKIENVNEVTEEPEVTLEESNDIKEEENSEEVKDVNDNVSKDTVDTYDSPIFETVDPFIEMPFFTDRTDEELDLKKETDTTVDSETLPVLELADDTSKEDKEPKLVLELDNIKSNDNNLDEEMPDAFWVTQEEKPLEDNDEDVLSFDEQIDALLSEDNNNVKVRKLAA